MRRSWITASLLALAALAVAEDPPAKPTLRVTATAAEDGRPIAGASVVVRGPRRAYRGGTSSNRPVTPESSKWTATAVADAHGDAVVPLGDGGVEDVRVDAAGRVSGRAFPGSNASDVTVSLELGTVVEGRVLDPDTKEAIAGARIRALLSKRSDGRRGLDEFGAGTSAADGAFRIDVLPPDETVVLLASAPGRGERRVRVRTGAAVGPATRAEFALSRPTAIVGVVRDAEGRPVADADVVAVERGIDDLRREIDSSPWPVLWVEDAREPVKSAKDGTFRIDGLSKAAYCVYATKREQRSGIETSASSSLVDGVSPPTEQPLDLTLTPFPRAFVRVREDGRPIASTGVITYIDGHGQYSSSSDADGWARVAPELGGLRRGRVRVRVQAAGYAPVESDVDLSSGKDVRVEIDLSLRQR